MSTSSVNPLSSLTDALSSSNSSSGSTNTSGAGLGQGIDVQEFVQYAVADQEAVITSLQSQQSTLDSQTTELSTIESDMSSLDTALQALSDPLGALAAQTVTSSDSGVISGTADSTASTGTHTITVSNLATTSSYYSDEVPSDSTTVSGSLSIAVDGGTAVNVPIDASDNTTTLSGIASYINSQSNLGVTATVVQDANGARLALVSNTSGASGALTVTGSLSYQDSSGNTDTANFNLGTKGVNANLTVDGIPVSSASNTVSNVIPGVTLNLGGTSSSPVDLSVQPDNSQITSAINNFVSAYNTVTTEINNQFDVTSTSSGGPLEGDNTLRQVQSMLLSAVSYSVTGNSGMVNLASMGVNMNDDGTLTVDNNTLSAALDSNPTAVVNFFQNATTGFAQQMDNVVQSINAPSTGMLALDAQGISSTSTDLTQQINDLQAALTTQEQELTQVYSQVNVTLQELPLLESQTSQQLASLSS
ncbi:MAG TPA: flagellar filament capping protein FliD [Candidatus Sulfotelmatobacter sp.]|nr:flagellar filament capping protein FliD [Candidatus Sulfotelmatobacter sp.]